MGQHKIEAANIGRETWNARKGEGGSMGRTLRKRERMVHTSVAFEAIRDEEGRFIRFDVDGLASRGTYRKPN